MHSTNTDDNYMAITDLDAGNSETNKSKYLSSEVYGLE